MWPIFYGTFFNQLAEVVIFVILPDVPSDIITSIHAMEVEVTLKALAILASWTCIHPAGPSGFLAKYLLGKLMGVDGKLLRGLVQGIDGTNEMFMVLAHTHIVGQFDR